MPENAIVHRLRRPYYLETSLLRRWGIACRYGGFVFLFLVIFQPFGLSSLPEGLLRVALGYAGVTFLVMTLLNVLFLRLFPVFSEEKWNVGKEIGWNLLNVLLIGAANAVYTGIIGLAHFSGYVLFVFELYTVTVAVIPITVTVLIRETRMKSRFEKRSEEINEVLPATENVQRVAHDLVQLVSENGKEQLSLNLDELLFIQSSDNYVEVHYTSGEQAQRRLLRNSLKALSEALEARRELFRCHKSYLVNLKKVKHVSGNAQGYKLHLSGTDALIPVSRQFNTTLKDRLAG